MALFEIDARAGSARAGVLRLAHGDVRTPAFVPLASNASVRGLDAPEVADAGLRHGAGQHLPPVHHARPRAHRQAGRAAPVHGLGPADHHRLRRLPGVLDGARLGGRRGQAPARQQPEPDPLDRGGGGQLPRLHRRRRALHGPGDLDGGAGRAGLGHRAGLRRVHPLPRGPGLHPALDGAHPPVAGPVRGVAGRARPRRPGLLRDRPGRRRPGAAGGVGGVHGGRGRGRHRHRRHARRGQGPDARGPGLVDGRPARGAAPPPARHRRRGRHRARGRHGHRHLRLRHAHAAGPARHRAGPRPRAALEDRPDQVRVARRPAAAVRGRRHAPLARLPALPGQGQGADRRAHPDAAQPGLHGAADDRHPAVDPRRRAGRSTRRRCWPARSRTASGCSPAGTA